MIHTQHEDISKWAARIDTVISQLAFSVVQRVVVMETTASTQDAAVEFASGKSGLLLIASQQTQGRGTHGRRWEDGDRNTLPCSFVLNPSGKDAPLLSACIACAVHETLATLLPAGADLKIKWPNDIVTREDGRDRKLAGILIEQRAGLTIVGIGINCTNTMSDWDQGFGSRAVSLNDLGAHVNRLDLVCRLVEHLSQWFESCSRKEISEYYELHDAMVGTLRTFKHNNVCYHGIVEGLDPLEYIRIETPSGHHLLPVATTKHLRGDEPCKCS